MTKLLVVGLGGFLGAISRYLIHGGMARILPASVLPAGTLMANGLGCLLIGLITGFAEVRGVLSDELRLLLVVGFLGSLTTFPRSGMTRWFICGSSR